MKRMREADLAGGVGVGLVLPLCVVRANSHADELLLVPPELRPTNGLFYSFQNPDHPPLPQNLFPELPLYWVEEDSFLVNDETVNYEALKTLWAPSFSVTSGAPTMNAFSSTDCGELTIPVLVLTNGSTVVSFSVTNVSEGVEVDVLTTYPLGLAPGLWKWLARATNGQVITVTNVNVVESYFTAACIANVLVNDPLQDYGNEQNTQFETTCVVAGTNIIVAWVDSNEGVFGLGGPAGDGTNYLSTYTPQFVAYAVSQDGGHTFQDMGEPPLSMQSNSTNINDNGDAGDPVLAVDRASSNSSHVYLVGTSPRNDGWRGIPIWKSTDGGVTFGQATNVMNSITKTDKPWVTVDDWPGDGQHDVYVAAKSIGSTPGFWLTVSSNGLMDNWSGPMLVTGASGQGIIPVIGPDHVAYTFWLEEDTNSINWSIKMCPISDQGTNVGDVGTVCDLVTTGDPNGDLALRRNNTATNTDTFKVPTLPAPAVNPARMGHLYVAFADLGTSANDKADVFLSSSTNGGLTWTNQRVNMDLTTNDQWMPVVAVKPDGERLFMAWYDRRNDINNGLIEVYGCFGDIDPNGSVAFRGELRISTASFPIVFVGERYKVEPIYKEDGYYDPVYPPHGVNLHWAYEEWAPESPGMGGHHPAASVYERHVGEYNGVFGDEHYVYLVWTDYRLLAEGTLVPREQSDVRFTRLFWP